MYYLKIYSKATVLVSELILTPFDIKHKKLNVENLRKFIFMPSRRVSFPYFPKVALDHRGKGGCPPISFKIFVDHVTILKSTPMCPPRWSSCDKEKVMAGNCCWLLLDRASS